jgi:hypothetical protein
MPRRRAGRRLGGVARSARPQVSARWLGVWVAEGVSGDAHVLPFRKRSTSATPQVAPADAHSCSIRAPGEDLQAGRPNHAKARVRQRTTQVPGATLMRTRTTRNEAAVIRGVVGRSAAPGRGSTRRWRAQRTHIMLRGGPGMWNTAVLSNTS